SSSRAPSTGTRPSIPPRPRGRSGSWPRPGRRRRARRPRPPPQAKSPRGSTSNGCAASGGAPSARRSSTRSTSSPAGTGTSSSRLRALMARSSTPTGSPSWRKTACRSALSPPNGLPRPCGRRGARSSSRCRPASRLKASSCGSGASSLRPPRRASVSRMATAVGVVFSPGGKVYSFDPGGLELAWNTKVICHTSRGQELGRVVQPNYELESAPQQPLKRIVRRATSADEELAAENRVEAKQAMKVMRELLRGRDLELKPVSAELVFDGSRIVFYYQSESRPELTELQEKLRRRLERRIELRSVGPRECARLCGDHGLCGDQHCCRRFPSHEQPIT